MIVLNTRLRKGPPNTIGFEMDILSGDGESILTFEGLLTTSTSKVRQSDQADLDLADELADLQEKHGVSGG
jgi:hypothetical protein